MSVLLRTSIKGPAEQRRTKECESFKREAGESTQMPWDLDRTEYPIETPARKVLFVSYSFPPVGGAGVQRATKFVKYLPAHGWQPVVLTVDNPSVPVTDASLNEDVPADCPIIRTRTWEPSYRSKEKLVANGEGIRTRWKSWLVSSAKTLLQPDPQCLWTLPTRLQLNNVDAYAPFDAVVVTGPPFSTFSLGRVLSRRYRVPLLLDFRDEWLLSVQTLEHHQQGSILGRWQRRLFRQSLKSADGITATTQASANYLREQCHALGLKTPVQAIYNGFDPDDFASSSSTAPRVQQTTKDGSLAKFVVAYHGTLWNLTDCSPLVASLQKLFRTHRAMANRLTLRLVGRVTEGQQASVDRLQATGVEVDQRDYVPHTESLRLAREADLLILLLADVRGAERVVPAKLFEYLALRRPILAITPPGEAAELLRRSPLATVFQPEQVNQITDWIHGCVAAGGFRAKTDATSCGHPELGWCARPQLTQQLASQLDDLVRLSQQRLKRGR